MDRAIWCCIAPYLLYPRSRNPRERAKTSYLAQLLLDLYGISKLPTRDRWINEQTFKLHDTIGWIRALVDAPSKTDIRDFAWGQKNKETRSDYLTTHRVIALCLRLEHNRDKDIWFSIENAKIICQSEPLKDYHSGRNKIDDALRYYKKSSHLIFGMLQAAANDGNHSALRVPERKHVNHYAKTATNM